MDSTAGSISPVPKAWFGGILARNVLIVFVLVFLLVPNGLAYWFWMSAARADEVRTLVQESNVTSFSKDGPFVAEGVLSSPSDDAIVSMHFNEPCLAFRTKLDRCYTVTNSDGEQEDKRSLIFEERRQVKDLQVEFDGDSAILDIQGIETFYNTRFADMDARPDYIPADRMPSDPIKGAWFEVFENHYLAGQTVTAVGTVNNLGVLGPHPVAGELLVYPGPRTEFDSALEKKSSWDRLLAKILVAVSFGVVALFALALKFVRSQN